MVALAIASEREQNDALRAEIARLQDKWQMATRSPGDYPKLQRIGNGWVVAVDVRTALIPAGETPWMGVLIAEVFASADAAYNAFVAWNEGGG